MRKLICLALSAVMLLSICGCTGKQAEFTPVEGFEEASKIIYNVPLGATIDEYKTGTTHLKLANTSRYYQIDEDDPSNEGYIEEYDSYTYVDHTIKDGSDVVYSATTTKAEFMDDKLISFSMAVSAVGENGSAEKQQEEIVDGYIEIAEAMGFVRQEDIPFYRYAFTVKDGYNFGDGVYFDRLDLSIVYAGSDMKWEANESMTQEEVECMESENVIVRADNDIIYYLSPDKTKALAICPQDTRSERSAIYFYGDNIWIERSDGVIFDPDIHDYEDFNGGKKPETVYAPVVIAYYDIAAVHENVDTIPSWVPHNALIVELSKDLDELGTDAFIEKYKEDISFAAFW